MDNGWVLFAYTVVYGFMVGYAIFLATRLRGLDKRVEEHRSVAEAAPAGDAITAPDLQRIREES